MAISFSKLGKFGRLGNCLWQIAVTISLAKKHNDSFLFPFGAHQQYLNLPPSCFSSNIQYQHQYQEPFFHYQDIPYRSNLDLVGYFQSKKYWQNYEDEIINYLTPKIAKTLPILKKTCAIHVRRTDYLNFPDHHPVLPISYYHKAMNMIKASKYMIFSDDIEWCKSNFIGEQFSFSNSKNPINDLCLMSKCEVGAIIANSSFSQWGAELNRNKSKIVVAPKIWFGKALNHDIKDLLPNEWVKI